MENREILILTPGFPKDEEDTSCIPSLQIFVKALSEQSGLKVRVVTTQYPFQIGTYQWHGIPVHACGGNNRDFPIKLFTILKAYWYLLLYGRKAKAIQCFWLMECSLIGLIWGQILNIKTVCRVQGQDCKAGNGYFGFIRFFSKLKNVSIVCISQFAADQLLKNGKIKTTEIIPDGIDIEKITNGGLKNERTTDLIGVGNLSSLKNYSQFIKVVSLIVNEIPNLKASIIGEGEQREILEKMISDLGLRHNIKLYGFLPRSEVLEKMKGSKIFLHTSLWEAQGYVLMEALSMGCYVVASPVGYLFPSQKSFISSDSQDIARTISKILQSENQDYSPIKLPNTQETIRKYLRIYWK